MRGALPVSLVSLALALGLGLLIVAAQGPLGPDLAITKALQGAFGGDSRWAVFLSDAAKPPVAFGVIAAVVLASALLRAPQAMVAAPISYAASFAADKFLRTMVYAPRPAADLVEIASVSASSGFPSTAALFYASLFGVPLFAARAGIVGSGVRACCAAVILSALTARAVLGGHWTSQLLASAALGVAIAGFATMIAPGNRAAAGT